MRRAVSRASTKWPDDIEGRLGLPSHQEFRPKPIWVAPHFGGTHMKILARGSAWFQTFALHFFLAALICAAVASVPAWADCSPASLSALNVHNMTIASATVVPAAAPNP